MKTRYPFLIVAAFGAATALHGALAELNVAEGTIETPDGAFISRDMSIAQDFKLELLYRPPVATQGQWVPMAWDTKGRLIVASYNSDHLLRLTIPPVGSNAPVQTEMIMENVGAAEGLLVAFDSLYMNVNRSTIRRHGVYRLTDTNNDDKYDSIHVIRIQQGNGDHGTHLTLGVARVLKGESLEAHRHLQPETYYVLSGAGVVTIDNVEHAVVADHMVFIPGDALHRIDNYSDEELRILYLFTEPDFSKVVYRF